MNQLFGSYSLSDPLPAEVRLLADEGRKIEAIKVLRNMNTPSFDLRSAKEAVERYLEQRKRIVAIDTMPVEVKILRWHTTLAGTAEVHRKYSIHQQGKFWRVDGDWWMFVGNYCDLDGPFTKVERINAIVS